MNFSSLRYVLTTTTVLSMKRAGSSSGVSTACTGAGTAADPYKEETSIKEKNLIAPRDVPPAPGTAAPFSSTFKLVSSAANPCSSGVSLSAGPFSNRSAAPSRRDA